MPAGSPTTSTRPVLTVGIPTFNRSEAVASAVEATLTRTVGLPIDVLVADNASPDDTLDRLAAFTADPRFTLIEGESNVGLAGNMARLARAAEGSYLLFLSDENRVADEQTMGDLVRFLNEERPSLAGPGRKLPRGWPVTEFDHFWNITSVLPGLIFEAEGIRTALERIESFEDPARIDEMWHTYPMVLLALDPWLAGRPFRVFGERFFDQHVALPTQWAPPAASTGAVHTLEKHASLPPGKQHYKHALSRLAQQEGLAVWVEHLRGEIGPMMDRSRLASFSRWQKGYAAGKLIGQLDDLYPNLAPALRVGVRRELGIIRRSAALLHRAVSKLRQGRRRQQPA